MYTCSLTVGFVAPGMAKPIFLYGTVISLEKWNFWKHNKVYTKSEKIGINIYAEK